MSAQVAVVGLNVAGSFALDPLEGCDAVGIEKRFEPGKPVECGELIPTEREIKTLIPSLENHHLFRIPRKFAVNKTRTIELILPDGTVIPSEFESYIINRDEMVQHMIERSDVEILTGHIVLALRGDVLTVRDRSTGREFELKADVVLGCDGGNSIVRRSLGMKRPDLCPTLQYVMKGVESEEDSVKMFIGRDIAPGGYAWIIPKGDGIANVGIGFRREYAREGDSIYKALERFVRKFGPSKDYLKNAKVVDRVGAVVPVDLPSETLIGNVILAGDAGSQIITHVGAGNPTGMICGRIAGEVVRGYLDGKLELREYERRWKRELLETLVESYRIKTLWDSVAGDESSMMRLMKKLVSREEMNTLIRGRLPLKLRFGRYLLPVLKRVV